MKNFLTKLSKVKFARDIATMQVGQVVTTASGFLASILFARLLGLQGYGTYAIVLAFTGLLGFVTNLGQHSTTLTFLAEAYGAKDTKRITEVLHYYFFLSMCSGLVMALLFPFLPAITDAMYGNTTIGHFARIIFVSSIIDPLFVFGTIALQSVREIRKLTILENSRIVLQLGLSVLFLIQGRGVEGVLLGTLIGTGLMSIVSLLTYSSIRSRYALPTFRQIFRVQSGKHLWALGKDGMWIAIDKNVGNLNPNIFIVVLGMYVPESVVGLMRLAFKLGSLPTAFVLTNISKLSASVIPTLSSSGANLKQSLMKLAAYSSCIHISATIALILVVPPMIPVVYGEAYSVALYPFMVIATLQISNAAHALMTPVLRLYSRIYLATTFNLVGLALSLTSFIVLMGSMRTTFAFYIALGIHHGIATLVVIPVLSLIRRQKLSRS